MQHERRRHERFPLILTARRRVTAQNRNLELKILELSVGGCFTECFPEARVGDNFRIEIPMIDGNWLPLECKVRYRFLTFGLGIEFLNVSEIQKEALADIIMNNLWSQDLLKNTPFASTASIGNPRKLKFA